MVPNLDERSGLSLLKGKETDGAFMFNEPRVNEIVSDEGFSVEVKLPNDIIYTEHGKVVRLFCELLVDSDCPLGIHVSRATRWDAPHDSESIDDATRARIADNLVRAFRFQGRRVDIS
jgi:hypothetical protein